MDFKNSKGVLNYVFGKGAFSCLAELIRARRGSENDFAVFYVDSFFDKGGLRLPLTKNDKVFFVSTEEEPTTEYVDTLYEKLVPSSQLPCVVTGIGGGSTLDVAKAIANLLTNGGKSENYQGWDLVQVPGVYKIGIPTLSGTGAEASRTCVLMNTKKNLKLGMNSPHTIYDQLVLDPELTRTVPQDQYFYTGMDTYIHCAESLRGSHRNAIGDAYSREAITLCREVFESADMQSDCNREKIMVASYLGGSAIANTYVGVVHPFSAGLSMVLKIHHCLANCIALNSLEEFYPDAVRELRKFLDLQRINLPRNVCNGLGEKEFERLYLSTIVHEKPLVNALGKDFRQILTFEKVVSIFRRM